MAWRSSIGRYVQSIKIMACPTSQSSAVARDFWDKNYTLVKHLNPTFPFMIREAPQLEPYMIVEYEFNRKVKVSLTGLDDSSLEKKFDDLVAIGMKMPRSEVPAGRALPSVIE